MSTEHGKGDTTETTDTAATTETAETTDTVYYIYGVVPATAPQPDDAVGVGSPPAPVELVRHGRIAAVVSEVDPAEPLGTPEDLRAHATVLDSLAADATPVLPFRFGGVARDRQAVAEDVLEPDEPGLATALEELGDLVQFTVRGVYDEEQVLSEILRERPDIARLHEEAKNLPAEEDAMKHQVRLGELISRELAVRRQADGQALLSALAPLATAAVDGAPGGEHAVDASFLLHPSERSDFEAAAEYLAHAWADRIVLSVLGPLAPYDFAAALVEHT